MIISNAILALENVLGITSFDFSNMVMILEDVLGTGTFSFFLGDFGYGWLYLTYNFATFIPSLAAGVRRFHDMGKSGKSYFIGLIPVIGVILLLLWFCKDSQAGTNKWGANPKE